MILEIYFPDKIKGIERREIEELKDFLQKISNRYAQGHCRYGSPSKTARYMTRIQMEHRAYKKSGNAEQLYNIAVYCLLEKLAPENKRHHYNPNADSVTRNKLKGSER